jgi:hypothetical protein
MENVDLVRAVNEMVALYGEDAARQAVARADKLLDRGDIDGCTFWRKIAQAIAEPPPDRLK